MGHFNILRDNFKKSDSPISQDFEIQKQLEHLTQLIFVYFSQALIPKKNLVTVECPTYILSLKLYRRQNLTFFRFGDV